MRLAAAASATRPQPNDVDDVHHLRTMTARNLLADRGALDALVEQLMPTLITVQSDVPAAATALAKVMLDLSFGSPLHSLRWVFALLQRIQVCLSPADSEFASRPQPNGTAFQLR